jgi:hypothetical protein
VDVDPRSPGRGVSEQTAGDGDSGRQPEDQVRNGLTRDPHFRNAGRGEPGRLGLQAEVAVRDSPEGEGAVGPADRSGDVPRAVEGDEGQPGFRHRKTLNIDHLAGDETARREPEVEMVVSFGADLDGRLDPWSHAEAFDHDVVQPLAEPRQSIASLAIGDDGSQADERLGGVPVGSHRSLSHGIAVVVEHLALQHGAAVQPDLHGFGVRIGRDRDPLDVD